MPEAAPTVDALRPVPGDERVLEIFEFDPQGPRLHRPRLQVPQGWPATGNAIVIGDMTNLRTDVFVLIERDSLFGAAAVVKRLYLIDLNVTDADGVLEKRLLIDLLEHRRSARHRRRRCPAFRRRSSTCPSTRSSACCGSMATTLAVAIDTNFPGEDGRTPGVPDSTEFIKLRFENDVASYAPRAGCAGHD